jgi:hypothetical protein
MRLRRSHIALISLTLLVLSGQHLYAQLGTLHSRQLEWGSPWNPSMIGTSGDQMIYLNYTDRWSSIEDAPQSVSALWHGPLANRNMALGFSLQAEQFAALEYLDFSAQYAYRLFFPNSKLSLGIGAHAIIENYAWAELDAYLDNDPAFLDAAQSEFRWKAEFGLWYDQDDFGAGFSIRDLNTEWEYNFGALGLWQFEERWAIRPLALMRIGSLSSIFAQTDVRFVFSEQFEFGPGYRSDGSLLLHLEYILQSHPLLKERYAFGYTFAFPVGQLNGVLGPTHELFFGFRFGSDRSRQVGPRFF